MFCIFFIIILFILLIAFLIDFVYKNDNLNDPDQTGFTLAGLFVLFIIYAVCCYPSVHKITLEDYKNAKSSLEYLELVPSITLINQDQINKAIQAIEDYQNKRDIIAKKANNPWNGIHFSPETLDEFPEVKLDTLLNKFN